MAEEGRRETKRKSGKTRGTYILVACLRLFSKSGYHSVHAIPTSLRYEHYTIHVQRNTSLLIRLLANGTFRCAWMTRCTSIPIHSQPSPNQAQTCAPHLLPKSIPLPISIQRLLHLHSLIALPSRPILLHHPPRRIFPHPLLNPPSHITHQPFVALAEIK